MAGLVLLTPPAEEVVSVADLKAQARITVDAEEELLEEFCVTARRSYEKEYGLALLTQTWQWSFDAFPRTPMLSLPLSPLQSVTSITYYDADDAATVWPDTAYFVDTSGARIAALAAGWPQELLRPANGVVIEFVAGYASLAVLREADTDTVAAIRERAAWLYEHREDGLLTRQGAFSPYA